MVTWNDVKDGLTYPFRAAKTDASRLYGGTKDAWNGNGANVDPTRRDVLKGVGVFALAGATNGERIVSGVADDYDVRSPITKRGAGEDTTNSENESDANFGGGDSNNDENTDAFEYTQSDLPFNSIVDGLAHQSDQAIDAFDDEFVEAYFNRNEDADQVVEDAYLDIDDATAEEYLKASSSDREDIDVVLGFRNGNEGLKLRGSASAGMDEDFEEYMVGLDHVGRFGREVDAYMDEVEDMLN